MQSGVRLHSANHMLLKIAFQPDSPSVFAVTGRNVLMGDLRARSVWTAVDFGGQDDNPLARVSAAVSLSKQFL
jgi:hypothetical protein